jgi:hypothetical protein
MNRLQPSIFRKNLRTTRCQYLAVRMLLSLLLILNFDSTWAKELLIDDAREFEIYKSATGSDDLAQRSKLVKEYKLHFQVCQKQLENEMIPLSCYEEVAAALKLLAIGVRLHTNSAKLGEMRAQLDQRCRAVAARVRFQSPWVNLAESVSPLCREAIEQNVALQRYKAAS